MLLLEQQGVWLDKTLFTSVGNLNATSNLEQGVWLDKILFASIGNLQNMINPLSVLTTWSFLYCLRGIIVQ